MEYFISLEFREGGTRHLVSQGSDDGHTLAGANSEGDRAASDEHFLAKGSRAKVSVLPLKEVNSPSTLFWSGFNMILDPL